MVDIKFIYLFLDAVGLVIQIVILRECERFWSISIFRSGNSNRILQLCNHFVQVWFWTCLVFLIIVFIKKKKKREKIHLESSRLIIYLFLHTVNYCRKCIVVLSEINLLSVFLLKRQSHFILLLFSIFWS